MGNEFENLYKDLEIKGVSLQDQCVHCNSCWYGINDRKHPSKSEYTKIYQPWVGKNYSQERVLIIGINMNEFGGQDAQVELVKKVRREMIEYPRARKFLSCPDYKGTLYWHRAPSYATAVLNQRRVLDCQWMDDGFPTNETLEKAFDYFAITNSIKCAPKGKRSKPTDSMWTNCPSFILKREIEILKPRTIILLRKENSKNFKRHIVGEKNYSTAVTRGNVDFVKTKIGNQEVDIFSITHPTAANGGSSLGIIDELNNLLYAPYFTLLKDRLKADLSWEFSEDFGVKTSGFYFKPKKWEHYKIGFEFDDAGLNNFFYGVKSKDAFNEKDLDLISRIQNRLNGHKNSDSPIWAWWQWFDEPHYKNWGLKTFEHIENGKFVTRIKEIVVAVTNQLTDLKM